MKHTLLALAVLFLLLGACKPVKTGKTKTAKKTAGQSEALKKRVREAKQKQKSKAFKVIQEAALSVETWEKKAKSGKEGLKAAKARHDKLIKDYEKQFGTMSSKTKAPKKSAEK